MKARELRALQNDIANALAGYSDITAFGIGEKFSNDEPTGSYAVVVYVEDKSNPGGQLIPPMLRLSGQDVLTDVRTAPRSDFMLANTSLDGSDLLIASHVGRVGTLGLVATEDGGPGRVFGITNAHVVSRPNEDHTGDAIEAVVNGISQVIGEVAFQSSYRAGNVNTVDLALIALNQTGRALARSFVIQNIDGVVVGSGSLSFSRFGGALREHKYGASRNQARDVVKCTQPSELSSVVLNDQNGASIGFGRAFVLRAGNPGVHAGHSGALLVRQKADGKLIGAGLLAGGRGSTAVAFSFTDIISELAAAGISLG